MKRFFVVFILMSLLAPAAFAHQPADGNVYAAFGPYLYQAHRYEESFNNPAMLGAMLTAEGDLGSYGGLELTLAYINPLFALEREDMKVVEQVKRMYIAMGWRHWFNPVFSVSPSFFSSYVMGDAYIVRNDFPTDDPPHTSARDPVDYGFALSVQYEAWRMEKLSVVVDGRYSYSVTPKAGEDMNQYGITVALKYFVQGKPPESEEESE